MPRACSKVLQGCTDDLRLDLLNVGVRFHPRFQGPTELHFQRYCVPVYPKLSGHSTSGRCMGPSRSGALVPFTPQFEIDHRLAVPSRRHFWIRFRFPARCGAQNYPVKYFSTDRRQDDDYGHRAISVLGLFVFQCCFYLSSTNRSAICWYALRF